MYINQHIPKNQKIPVNIISVIANIICVSNNNYCIITMILITTVIQCIYEYRWTLSFQI